MIRTSLAETEMKVSSMLMRIMSMGLIVIVGLLIVIPLTMNRKVLRPIESVLSVTAEISRGDLTRAVDMPSKDEMGKLVGFIESMRKGLFVQGLKNATSEQSEGSDLISRAGEDILSQVSFIKKR